MSCSDEQNMLYPEEQKQWIIHELKEAEKKGAIVIVPAWNTSIDMDKVEFLQHGSRHGVRYGKEHGSRLHPPRPNPDGRAGGETLFKFAEMWNTER